MGTPSECPGTLRVNEVYASIQGESTFAGWPCVLIRLAGCPLRCSYCDTPQARADGEEVALPDLLSAVEKLGIRLVEVTGGEPLAQPAARTLIRALVEKGHEVLVETGGGVSIEGVDPRARIILDVKTPGSGMHDRQDWGNLDRLRPGDEVKFVICSRRDYEWARDQVRRSRLADRHIVHFSPAEAGDPAEDSQGPDASARSELPKRKLAEWILEDRLPVRLNLQLQAWIWGPGARGV